MLMEVKSTILKLDHTDSYVKLEIWASYSDSLWLAHMEVGMIVIIVLIFYVNNFREYCFQQTICKTKQIWVYLLKELRLELFYWQSVLEYLTKHRIICLENVIINSLLFILWTDLFTNYGIHEWLLDGSCLGGSIKLLFESIKNEGLEFLL